MAGLLVLAVIGAAVMLSGAAANAAPPPGTLGTLTFTPTTGLATTIITAHTSAGCSTGGNAADLEVTGPVGAANPTFPPGTVVTTTENNTFSTTGPFTVPEGLFLKDVADLNHTTIQPGEYDFTVVCMDQDLLTRFGTFTGVIFFSDPTHYYTGTIPPPTPIQTPTPIPTPTPRPTPLPTPLGTLTVTPSMGSDTTIITATTSRGCDIPDGVTGAADLEITGPVGAANPVFPPGTPVTTTQNNSFSTTGPFSVPAEWQLRDIPSPRPLIAGEYDLTVNCMDQNLLTRFGTFTGAISFTDSTHYISAGSTLTPIPGGPTPTPLPQTPIPSPVAHPTVTPTPTPSSTPAPPTNCPYHCTPSPMPPTPTPMPATLTADPPSPFGQTGDRKVTLTMRAPGIYAGAGGTWLLTDDGARLVSSSVAQGDNEFRWEWTPVWNGTHDTHHLVATFHPDCTVGQYCPPDATAALNYQVFEAYPTPVAVALTLGVTPASGVPAGTTETLTATVSPPLGRVQFYDGDTLIDSPTTGTDGVFSTTTTLPPGTHTLIATDSPPQPYPLGGFTSRSPVVTYVVNAPTPTPAPPAPPQPGQATDTTTTLRVAPNPGFTFLPEILTARVAPFGAVGTVQFLDGTTPLGSPVPLFGGFAWLITPLPAGTHTLTAIFLPPNLGIGGCTTTGGFDGSTPLPCPPSAGFMPSASAPVSLTVQSTFGGLGFWGGNTPPWPLLGRNTPPGALPGGAFTPGRGPTR